LRSAEPFAPSRFAGRRRACGVLHAISGTARAPCAARCIASRTTPSVVPGREHRISTRPDLTRDVHAGGASTRCAAPHHLVAGGLAVHSPASQLRPRALALALAVLITGAAAGEALAAYTRLQVLLPGEVPSPGTATGKTGTPNAQVVGVPFDVTFRACDDGWNLEPTISNAIQTLSSDASASLPAPVQLVGGTRTVTVTFHAAGSFTVTGHDQTDGTIPDGVSATVSAQVLHGFEFSRINQKNQYAGVPMTITVEAVDAVGDRVTGYNGPVLLREITSFGEGRCSPSMVTLAAGSWTGPVTMYRADETSINRGNVNLFAWLGAAPSINGTSDPFTVHPGSFSRLQIVVPGQNPLPGSVSGLTGSPATQSSGSPFPVAVYATDNWWNPVPSGDNVRITSSDPAASTPVSGNLSNGIAAFNVSLGTVGTQTLTVNDQTSGGIAGMTSAGIAVIPSGAHHFEITPISTPQVAGVPVNVTIRATDVNGNTIPGYAGEANLSANTGAGSITPERVTFASGEWTGQITFRGAGGSVMFTVADFASTPHTGTSNSFVVSPGPFAGLQVILPGETPQGGTPAGKIGTPSDQTAGSSFVVTLRAVDAYWNLVPGIGHRVSLGSTDAFAAMPAETTLANGQRLVPVRLHRAGYQRIWSADLDEPGARADTSGSVRIIGGTFSRVLVLAPGESPAPGTASGRTGAATDQSINYEFTVTVLATDPWWNPVTGVTDVVRIGSDDPLATLPPDTPLVDGRADLPVRLARGGYNQISVSDVTDPGKTGSATQVRAISSGFHLEASISPATARAGEPFTITVRVTNDAGSVIQEINSFVTLEVQNASTRAAGRGTLLSTQFQLLQGQRSVAETYTFVEPIVVIARDDQGNAPATSNVILVTPGPPSAVRLSSQPAWVGGNKHAEIRARLVDAFENGVPGEPMTFEQLAGGGTLTPVDAGTDTAGWARADFLSPREPQVTRLRASGGGLEALLDLQTAFVDPNAAGGTITNYPNPFRPPSEPTTFAWKLADDATVTLRIFTQSGDLVLSRSFARGAEGGRGGLNEWAWDGRNGEGRLVASGGYVVLVEAQGTSETMHVMRRKIAAVR